MQKTFATLALLTAACGRMADCCSISANALPLPPHKSATTSGLNAPTCGNSAPS